MESRLITKIYLAGGDAHAGLPTLPAKPRGDILPRMPQKEFEIWLDGATRLLICRETHGGRLVEFTVVLLAMLDGVWVDIGRFDCAHGCPHEDVLGRKAGLLQKVWYDNLSYRQAYEWAIIRFRDDYENIRQQYLAH